MLDALATGGRFNYVGGMTVAAIKAAIQELSDDERVQLTDWLEKFEDLAWDRQMNEDLRSGGRGAHLRDKVDQQIDAGNFTSLEDGLGSARGG